MVEALAEKLPNRVGAPPSIRNLSLLLQAGHEAVERWVAILERMYLCFRVPPYGAQRIRAVRKEQKLHMWDWSQVPDAGERFENLVASQLLKYCHLLEDTEGYRMELRCIRDTDRREVDFVVLQDTKPLFAVECKTGERTVNPAIRYFIVLEGSHRPDNVKSTCGAMNVDTYCTSKQEVRAIEKGEKK